MRGESTREESREVVRELLLRSGPAEPAFEQPPGEESTYDAVFDRVLGAAAVAQARADAERLTALELADELELELGRKPVAELIETVQLRSRYRSWSLSEVLRSRSFDAGLNDPEGATALARLSLEVARQCAGPDPSRLDHDSMAAAWGQLGNALRIASDLSGSVHALRAAGEHLDRGTGDPIAQGQLLSIEASLDSDRSRFAAGITRCRRAAEIYRRAGDRHGRGRVLIQEAYLQVEAGDLAAAIACLDASLDQIEPALEPRLVLVVQHNLIAHLDEEGRYSEARERLPEARRLAREIGHRLDQIRLLWLEGRIAAHEAEMGHAETCLTAARDAFVELGVAYDAALVALQLAGVLAPQERLAEVRQLAEEMLPIFESRDLHAHAQAALKMFCDAAREETVGVELVHEILDYLVAARDRPELSFRAPA